MLAVGFEPTRANTEHLKCFPLDLLGHASVKKNKSFWKHKAVFHRYQPTLSRAATGIEPASGHKK